MTRKVKWGATPKFPDNPGVPISILVRNDNIGWFTIILRPS